MIESALPPSNEPTAGPPKAHHEQASPPPSFSSPLSSDSSSDPWQRMLGPSATPKQVMQFKMGVLKALSVQIAVERDRMVEALRKMREEYQ
jgi:hypothetical protein